MRLLGEFKSPHPMRTPVGVAGCLRHMILKLINSELLHAAGTIVKLPTNYNFYFLHSKKAQDSLLSKAILWFFFLMHFLTLSSIYVDALSSSFLWYRSFCQQYISRTLQSLSNFEILLRCSTSPSAEALDFVYNLRRSSLIKINLGFTVFIFVRFGFKGRRREWDLVTSASWGMVPSQLCYPLSPQLVCDTRVLTST